MTKVSVYTNASILPVETEMNVNRVEVESSTGEKLQIRFLASGWIEVEAEDGTIEQEAVGTDDNRVILRCLVEGSRN